MIKTARAHLMDAVPLIVGPEWSRGARRPRDGTSRIHASEVDLLQLAVGGTAVGTGFSAPADFSREWLVGLPSSPARAW